MNFREWVVRQFSPRLDLSQDQLKMAALAAMYGPQRQQRQLLDWEINGEYLTAQWDHPIYGEGWLSIRPTSYGQFKLHRDFLERARTSTMGVYDTYGEAQQVAENTVLLARRGA